MQHALIGAVRRALNRRGGDGGFAIIMVGLLLVAFLVITAIVVDLGNARQQNRQAVAAADAGALAGAQALAATTQTPTGCADASCVAAYYTLASSDLAPSNVTSFANARGGCTLETVMSGETCWQYTSGKATLDVKSPYRLDGDPADNSLVHVKVCWGAPTSFARVIGTSSINVCGSATARNSGLGQGSAGSLVPIPDCGGEDNFADANDNPTVYTFNPGDYPAMGGTINFAKGSATPKADQILAVLFNGFDSDLDLSSIKFVAPTNASGPNGTTVTLPLASGGTNLDPESSSAHGIGYTLQSLDAAGKLQPYTVGGTFQVVIAYQLPDDNHLQVNDKDFTFTSTLHAADKDQNPGEDCGNASWIFTHDGKHVSPAVGTCGENSFLGNGVFPSTGKAKPGDPVGAYYSDESPIQNRDITDPFWNGQAVNAGIDFELSGGKFTDPATGKGFQIPQSNGSNGGYTLGAFPSGVPTTDKFSTMIKWILPAADDPRWQNGIKYTVFLKAYDTDNNKPGNDCGQGTWSFVLSGATGHGTINLIE